MAWEAINNIAADKDLPLTIVVNDNERSYAPTTGGLAQHLATLRTTRGYERFLAWGKQTLGRTPVVGGAMYETLHGVKKGLKDIVAPQGMFEDLGLKYVGPVDGHDIDAVERALRRARAYGGPVLVHVITQKGRGYAPALAHEADRFHAVGPIDPETGEAVISSGASSPKPWTSVFEDEIARIAEERSDVVGITAAMCQPVGLGEARSGPPRASLRRRHRRAARHHQCRRSGLRRSAPGVRGVRDVPQPRVRPGADGRRAAPGGRHVRARPGGGHRPGRREPPRRVGPVGAAGRAWHPPVRPARRRDAARGAARGAGRLGRPDRRALPEGHGAGRRPHRRRAGGRRRRPGAQRRRRRPAGHGRHHGPARSRRRRAAARPRHVGDRRRPPLGAAGRPRAAAAGRRGAPRGRGRGRLSRRRRRCSAGSRGP